MKKTIKQTIINARKNRVKPPALEKKSYERGLRQYLDKVDAERSADVDAYYYGLNKEEVLDEISSKLGHEYIYQAAKARDNAAETASWLSHPAERIRWGREQMKRDKGVKMALNKSRKLAKVPFSEEVTGGLILSEVSLSRAMDRLKEAAPSMADVRKVNAGYNQGFDGKPPHDEHKDDRDYMSAYSIGREDGQARKRHLRNMKNQRTVAETTQIDELSKDTLRRYRMKAIYDRKEAEERGDDKRQEKREKGIKTAVDKLMTKESWVHDDAAYKEYQKGQLKLRNQGRTRFMVDYTAKKHFGGDRQEAAKFANSHVGKLHHQWDEDYFDQHDHGDGIPVHIHDRDRKEHVDSLVKTYKGMQAAAKPATYRPFASLKKESVDESRMTKEYQKERPGMLPPLRRGAGDKKIDILMDKMKGIKRRYQKGDHFKSPLPESKED